MSKTKSTKKSKAARNTSRAKKPDAPEVPETVELNEPTPNHKHVGEPVPPDNVKEGEAIAESGETVHPESPDAACESPEEDLENLDPPNETEDVAGPAGNGRAESLAPTSSTKASGEKRFVTISIPVVQPGDGYLVGRNVGGIGISAIGREGLRALLTSLRKDVAMKANGQPINSAQDALRWLLDQLGEAWVILQHE